MQTRKYPRTMQAAFGPHTDNNLQPMPEADPPFDWQDRVVIWGSAATAVICLVLALAGWIV